jgi:hypothetical protein
VDKKDTFVSLVLTVSQFLLLLPGLVRFVHIVFKCKKKKESTTRLPHILHLTLLEAFSIILLTYHYFVEVISYLQILFIPTVLITL